MNRSGRRKTNNRKTMGARHRCGAAKEEEERGEKAKQGERSGKNGDVKFELERKEKNTKE